MGLSKEEMSRLYTIRKTVMEMLKDRGYDVTQLEIDMSKDDFMNTYGQHMNREDLDVQRINQHNSGDQICVFFPEEAKIGVKMIRTYVSRLHSENISKAILILKEKPTGLALTCINKIYPKFHLEIFLEEELMFNVTKHVHVPKYSVLTETEKKALLEKYTVKETQLPRIQMNDPVSKYYGLELGQVVKVIRPSETAGRYITYRIVV